MWNGCLQLCSETRRMGAFSSTGQPLCHPLSPSTRLSVVWKLVRDTDDRGILVDRSAIVSPLSPSKYPFVVCELVRAKHDAGVLVDRLDIALPLPPSAKGKISHVVLFQLQFTFKAFHWAIEMSVCSVQAALLILPCGGLYIEGCTCSII